MSAIDDTRKINRQARVFSDVRNERYRQDSKWGDQSANADHLWATIHGEEYGEVCQAILSQKPTDAQDLYAELIQLAATCCAHAEALIVRGQAN